MLRLVERSVEEGVAHHQGNPIRVYETDAVQAERIRISRHFLNFCLRKCEPPADVWELGCGTADISGPESVRHSVCGVDCSDGAVKKAQERFPNGQFITGVVEDAEPRTCDVIVLCEVLEHISDPMALVARWLPMAEWSVISHPLDEPFGSPLSGGDHCWSFTEKDFREWFRAGAHRMIESAVIQEGRYRVAVGTGRRIETAT